MSWNKFNIKDITKLIRVHRTIDIIYRSNKLLIKNLVKNQNMENNNKMVSKILYFYKIAQNSSGGQPPPPKLSYFYAKLF